MAGYGFGAAIPAANGSFLSCFPGVQGMFLRLMLTLAGTKPPAAAIRSGLCSELDEVLAAKVVESFVPESKRLYMDKRRHSELPRHALYVQLKQDREFNAGMQQRMMENLQAAQAAVMDSGHLPMLSKPDELARICMQYADTLSSQPFLLQWN
ncbi:hypothetical protein K0T92_16655 [Paenibacillus oenotherae]|uniref:Uncharacterized protein n=1 Tax=Paenibacillus oenotherae TaxID=1435645 RepID=A0ABS7D940_9BACL|nr:hypothetical protein [Paenibacillus oenotherae]MBW7476366.1 hypothetical protein [Paenibacillus oenotherae]